jgi:hypothetical protein
MRLIRANTSSVAQIFEIRRSTLRCNTPAKKTVYLLLE